MDRLRSAAKQLSRGRAQSDLQCIAIVIELFEHRSQIISFQLLRRSLSLTSLKLEMSFTVNREGLLESWQLRAEVDDNQDAGTLPTWSEEQANPLLHQQPT